MPVDFTNLENFYKSLTPTDLYGKTKQIDSKNLVSVESEVYENYLIGAYSGEEIINNLSSKTIDGLGVFFNTVYQGAGNSTAKYLEPQYWYARSIDNIVSGSTPKVAPSNFYSQVCQNKSTSPPVDFSINLLRSAYATQGVSKGKSVLPYGIRNCDAVEFFLNYMPSIFPSMMVPYFEVEFDFPIKLPTQNSNDSRPLDAFFLNRPSLLRFLLGSSKIGDPKSGISLSEADKALIFAKEVKTRSGKIEPAYNVGMEIFTSPQTLTNMDSLGPNAGASRVVDVKPFLPPSTLTGGSITVLNSGAGAFASTKASVQFVVHDKARVAEFSEFFRIAYGTQDITVWITFGWLSPRGDIENDAYAKFINETMLQKLAFNIGNASFSFDTYGQASVSLELLSQGQPFVDSYQLTYEDGDALFGDLKRIKESITKLEQAQNALGQLPSQTATIKIVKDAKAGIDSGGTKALKSDEIQKINSAINQLNGSSLPSDIKDPIISGLNAALTLNEFYKKDGSLRKDSRTYSHKKFEECRNPDSLDPFLPEAFKRELTIGGKPYIVFKDTLTKEIEDLNAELKIIETKTVGGKKTVKVGKRRIVSFGKVFSSFCLPPILEMAKSQNIEEVQVNFYQLNESCGPLSLHSVAEFPVDLDILSEQFAIESEKVGGELMTIGRFMKFVMNTYINDNRAIGYGLTRFYENYTPEKPAVKNKPNQQGGFNFDDAMTSWVNKYGRLVQPHINIKIEVVKKRTVSSNIDLLTEIRNPDAVNASKIMKIHIFDGHANPYDNVKQRLLKNSAGAYLGLPQEQINAELVDPKYDKRSESGTIGDVTIVAKSQNPLYEFIGNSIPTLTIGANGSLISSINVSSKLDSKLATALMVPTQKNFRSKNTLSPNGLMMSETDLPVRITDSSITMTSLGCPIADLYQHFFVDFGTGTTLDNVYAATSINHSFGSGKFETSWSFIPVDGYGAFSGAQSVADAVKEATTPTPPVEKKK